MQTLAKSCEINQFNTEGFGFNISFCIQDKQQNHNNKTTTTKQRDGK